MVSGRTGGYRLSIQGGGMRVAYALGAVDAVRAAGIRIKSLSCSSAGTVAALGYFAPDFEAYSEELMTRLASRRFINPLRVWRIADMDYLVDDVVFSMIHPDMLCQEGPEIWVSLVDSKEATLTHVRLTPANARVLLKATMAIPILYGNPVRFEEARYFDGGIADSIPVLHSASLSDPGDILLSIATKPIDRLRHHRNGVGERAAILLDPRVSRTMRHLILAPNPLVSMTLDVVDRGSVGSNSVHVCEPSNPGINISRTNTDRADLVEIRSLGREDMTSVLAEMAGPQPT